MAGYRDMDDYDEFDDLEDLDEIEDLEVLDEMDRDHRSEYEELEYHDLINGFSSRKKQETSRSTYKKTDYRSSGRSSYPKTNDSDSYRSSYRGSDYQSPRRRSSGKKSSNELTGPEIAMIAVIGFIIFCLIFNAFHLRDIVLGLIFLGFIL